MKRTLLLALALLGLPLVGLEAQTNLDLVNEVLAARECSQSEFDDGRGETRALECTFTMGEDLKFQTLRWSTEESTTASVAVSYQRQNGNFTLRATMSPRPGDCVTVLTNLHNRKYSEQTSVYVSPRTGNVYADSFEDYQKCGTDG